MKEFYTNRRRARLLEGIALLLLTAAAILFQRSASATWFESRAPDGRRIQVSPIGVVDYGLGTTGTAPVECRWWPRLGDESLCAVAPGGASKMGALRRAYPLVVIALWTSVLALFLNALRIPRLPRVVGVIAAAVVPTLGVAAIWSVAVAGRGTLAILAGLPLAFLSGAALVIIATVASATAVVLLSFGRR